MWEEKGYVQHPGGVREKKRKVSSVIRHVGEKTLERNFTSRVGDRENLLPRDLELCLGRKKSSSVVDTAGHPIDAGMVTTAVV